MTDYKIEIINQVKKVKDYFCSIKKFGLLIPEVRTNISVATKDAKNREQIAAIEGRITLIGGFPKACGGIKFGVSDHTARLLLTAKSYDTDVNIVMNLKFIPDLIKKIKNKTNLQLREIKRREQPSKTKEKEHSTMQWLIKKTVEDSSRIPDIIWDIGAMGKEPMMRLFAKNAKDMIEKLEQILELI